MKSVCSEFPSPTITNSDFEDSFSSLSNSENSSADSDEEDENGIKYYQWLSVDGKASKVRVCTRIDEIKNVLLDKIKELKLHLFVRNEQYNTYNRLKNEMSDNNMLVHVDYSESYENKQQDECQSPYFGPSTFSIFPEIVYIRRNGELLHESIVIISEAKDHSRIAAYTYLPT